MVVHNKKPLREQQEIISAVMALTALTVLRTRKTSQALTETQELFERIYELIKRVFGINPRQEFLTKKRGQMKSVLVFISSNNEFYGDLLWNVNKLFLYDLKKGQSDALIIGKVGRSLIEKERLSNRITYFDLDDDKPDLKIVQQIIEILEQYDKVVVYHGRSESLLRQVPTRSEISKELPIVIKPTKKYFFEPTPAEVLELLRVNASSNSFYQKIYEAQIARLQARRWAWMKQQLTREKLLEDLTRELVKYKKAVFQKQQQVALFAQRLNRNI